MEKSKTKRKGLLKGVAVGFAFVLCSAFFPVNALMVKAADYKGEDNVVASTKTLSVGEEQNGNVQTCETRVKKGETVTVPTAVYKYGTSKTLEVKHGGENSADGGKITANVKVFYQATNDEVAIKSDSTFEADRIGRYVIVYTVEDKTEETKPQTYTYEMVVICEANDVTFEFVANKSNIIPTVYDRALANKKDIVLPMPTVKDEDGEEILTENDDKYYTTNKNGFTEPSIEGTAKKNAFVEVRLASTVEVGADDSRHNIEIKSRDNGGKTEYYIDGDDLDYESLDGKTFQLIYSYYTINTESKPVFIASITKSFTVEQDYYFTSDAEDKENGLELTPNWSASTTDLTAVVGVERDLPKITATTSAENSPASEAVEVYYTIKVFMKGDNGKYDVEVTNDNTKIDTDLLKEGKFKSKVEGSFRFVYEVKDFYDNTINQTKTSFIIDNVKDTRAANVYVYDGKDTSYNEKDNSYVSVENKIKNRSVNRNIILYAVGGTDNMVAKEDLKLRREIRDNTTLSKYIIGDDEDESIYNSYNLIFAPKVESGEQNLDNVLKQIILDNYELSKQMLLAGKNTSDVNDIKTFLKDNRFLLVTTKFNQGVGGESDVIVPELTESDEQVREKLINNSQSGVGYAWIKPQSENRADFDDEPSITLYYYASDGINSETRKLYTVNLSSGYSDNETPTVTFPTDLQAAYLPTDKIEFNVASATDTQDTRLDTVTAYRFLSGTKEPVESTLTAGSFEYVIAKKENVNDKDKNKWYVTQADTNGVLKGTGWYLDTTKTSYTIDLSDERIPTTAEYVEILAYAVDDDGNIGFFNKVVKIARVVDGDMPTLYMVENAPTATEIEAPKEINLPTLYFKDAGVNYMSAQVTILRIVKGEGDEVTKTYLQNLNMSTEFDVSRGIFKVNAGYFRASTTGEYQVAVTVKDASNHSVTTYFVYDVKGGAVEDEPEIDNITSDPVDLEPGAHYYLTPPTISIIKDEEKYGYVGLEDGDDGYTATNYTTTVISANADYTLDQYYFSASQRGLFKMKYKVYILRYDKEIFADNAADGKLYLDETGALRYQKSSKNYYVYVDRDQQKVVVHEDPLGIDTSKDLATSNSSEYNSLMSHLKLWVKESKVITINVGGVSVDVTIDEDYYNRSYETLGEKIEIIKPTSIQYNGEGYKTNNKESTVVITKTVKGSTTTLASLNFEEWSSVLTEKNNEDFEISDDNTRDNKVVLKLVSNGVYHIKYSIQAQDRTGNNVGEPKVLEYDIKNGDTVPPKLTLGKDLTQAQYKVGDKMVLNLEALTMSDTITQDRDQLLSTLRVSIANTTLNESSTQIYNSADEDGKYLFEKELEQAGTYQLTISVKDEAGNETSRTYSFEVTTDEKSAVNVTEVMGGVLIGLSVAILAGVVIYFVVSKVKLDKKEKRYKE